MSKNNINNHIELSKSSQKFLKKLTNKSKNLILNKIKEQYPSPVGDIKILKGVKKGKTFYRLRSGDIRILFTYTIINKELKLNIADIDYRSSIKYNKKR